VDRRPAAASLAFERGAPAVALDVHLEDRGVVHEAVDDSHRHRLVGEDLAPFAERLIGRDEEGSPFIAGADELKEHTGFGLVFGDVSEVIEDQQVIFVEPGNSGFERELAAGNLQPLDEIGGAGEQNAPAVLDKSEAQCRREMAFAAAGRGRDMLPNTTGRTRRFITPFTRVAAGGSRLCSVIRFAASRCW
jgi:hypothetical protein